MTKFISKISFFVLTVLFLVSSCTQDPSGVGTILNNPTLPKPNLIPNFEDYLPEATLGETASAASSAKSLMAESESEETLSGPAEEWSLVFIEGPVSRSRVIRSNMQEFGEAALNALTTAGITEATDEVQTASLGNMTIIDTTANWNVDYVAEDDESTGEKYVRMYFRNLDLDPENGIGLIQASYVFKTENDLPVKGSFAYANLEPPSEPAMRFVAFAFDFTSSDRNLLVMRVEITGDETFHAHYQCDLGSKNCSGQLIEISSPPPTRSFTRTLRYDWNDSSGDVCIAYVAFGESDYTLTTTQGFTAPPTAGAVTEGECALIAEAYWYDYVYTVDKLPLRYNDTDPVGGTALAYYIDGISKEGWILTPNLIDKWLRGEEF